MVIAIICVLIFLAILFAIGVAARKFVTNTKDFLLAGREMSFGLNMMGFVASGFAGTTITLMPSFTMTYGLSGAIIYVCCFGVIGMMLYGLLFSKTIRRSGAYTIAEWLEMRYGSNVRKILSLSGLIGMIAVTANNCLSLANVLSGFFGWSIYVSIAIGVITFLFFTYLAGFWGVTLTDFVQAVIGCVGAPMLLIALIAYFGGMGDNYDLWTAKWNTDFYTQGLSGAVLPGLKIVYPSMLTMAFALGINLVWGGQHYWIRSASCRNEKVARNVYIVGAVVLILIHILIGLIGFYAGANFGDQFTVGGGKSLPTMAYGLTIARFPMAMGIFLLVFALAAALSTCSTTLIAAVSLSVKDIYPKFINKNPTDKQLTQVARIATVVVSLLSWALAYYPGGAVFLFAFATAWMAPAGILLFLGVFWRRCTPAAAFAGALFALVIESIWAVMDFLKIPLAGAPVSSYIHIGILGFVSTIVPVVIISFFTKPKYYGLPNWTLKEQL
jgi:SSS family solute:Na+ symporter